MRILHIHAGALPEWARARDQALMNALGKRVEHVIAAPSNVAQALREGVDRAAGVRIAADFPTLDGRPTPGRLQRLARAMQGFDLVLTHDWSTVNAALAHAVFRNQMDLPPLVHHEDVLDPEEAAGGRRSRAWVRRVALWRAAALVVPDREVEARALGAWQQPRGRIRLVRPGVRIPAVTRKVRTDALPRLVKRPGELWLGAWGDDPLGRGQHGDGPQEERALAVLRALPDMPDAWRLIVPVNDGARERLMDDAVRLAIEHRVLPVPPTIDRAVALRLLDIFVPLADPAPDPVPAIEAMAVGLPLAGRGAIIETLGAPNRSLLAEAPADRASDGAWLAAVLARLGGDEALRRQAGEANRAAAVRHHDAQAMTAALREIYAGVLGKPALP